MRVMAFDQTKSKHNIQLPMYGNRKRVTISLKYKWHKKFLNA